MAEPNNNEERPAQPANTSDPVFKWAVLLVFAMFVAALSYRVVTQGASVPVTIINNGCGDCGEHKAEKAAATKPKPVVHRPQVLTLRVRVEPVQQACYQPQPPATCYSGSYRDGPGAAASRWPSPPPRFARPYRFR
jgi:hypothetical protein